MPAPIVYDEDVPFDPDTLKMPESPSHRQACDVIGLAAVELLGADAEVYRDMNWYPLDGGNAMAPDVMVLPPGALVAPTGNADEVPKSYRQDLTGGLLPLVSIEVPSHRDTLVALMTEIERCRRLGVVVYLVTTEGAPSVLRYAPGDKSPQSWEGRPIDELGGLRISFSESDDRSATMEVTMPDGVRARSDHELMTASAERVVADALAEIDALRQQLRRHGLEPDDGPG